MQSKILSGGFLFFIFGIVSTATAQLQFGAPATPEAPTDDFFATITPMDDDGIFAIVTGTTTCLLPQDLYEIEIVNLNGNLSTYDAPLEANSSGFSALIPGAYLNETVVAVTLVNSSGISVASFVAIVEKPVVTEKTPFKKVKAADAVTANGGNNPNTGQSGENTIINNRKLTFLCANWEFDLSKGTHDCGGNGNPVINIPNDTNSEIDVLTTTEVIEVKTGGNPGLPADDQVKKQIIFCHHHKKPKYVVCVNEAHVTINDATTFVNKWKVHGKGSDRRTLGLDERRNCWKPNQIDLGLL